MALAAHRCARRGRSRPVAGAEERGEPRGQRPRPEGGEVVVEVAVCGGEDDGGDALRHRPGFEPGRGAPARGVAVGGDEEAGGAGGRDEGGEAAGRERSSGGQRGDGGDEGEHGLDALADEEGGAVVPGRCEAHGVAVDAPERLAGLGDRGLGGTLGMEPGALHAFEGTVRAGDGGDEGGEAAPARGVAVGERGMEAQRREAAVPQSPGAEVGVGQGAFEGAAASPQAPGRGGAVPGRGRVRPNVSAPGTALLTRIDEGALERVSSEGIGVEPGGQQGFDLGE